MSVDFVRPLNLAESGRGDASCLEVEQHIAWATARRTIDVLNVEAGRELTQVLVA